MTRYLREPPPVRGGAVAAAPGVWRIVARNPGPMTYHGSNTWLVDDDAGGLTVIDPGPDDPAHLQAILNAAAGRIKRILLTHNHPDHIGNLASLKEATGVASHGWAATPARHVDFGLKDGASIGGMRALHTPGHAVEHLCFEWRDGIIFSGDHVMGWASTIVNPPGGDMTDYCHSLERLLDRGHRLYLPGHGPAIEQPVAWVRSLLAHRIRRERAIARVVRQAPATGVEIANRLYGSLPPMLRVAAGRIVEAHLLKLERDALIASEGPIWHWTSG